MFKNIIIGTLTIALACALFYIGWQRYSKPLVPAAVSCKPSTTTHTTTTVISKPDGGSVSTTITDSVVVPPKAQRNWRLDLGISRPWNDLREAPNVYELGLSYRAFGNVWAGLSVTSDKELKLNTGVEF